MLRQKLAVLVLPGVLGSAHKQQVFQKMGQSLQIFLQKARKKIVRMSALEVWNKGENCIPKN
jgi:hypothetical protein